MVFLKMISGFSRRGGLGKPVVDGSAQAPGRSPFGPYTGGPQTIQVVEQIEKIRRC
jgi:hypothetical protein